MSHPFAILQRQGKPFKGVFQVGANSGQEVQAFKDYGLKWAIMVEPLDDPYETLCAKVANLKNFIPVQALCSSLDGSEYDFHVASNAGQSSSILAPKRHLSLHPHVRFSGTKKLKSTTVDTIVARLEAEISDFSITDLDLMIIDVQGAELKVLMGAMRLLQNVNYIWTEVNYGDLYKNDISLEGLQAFLRVFGFRLNQLRMNKNDWGDALFIKK